MYNPAHFREERKDVLYSAIDQTRLCTLVTLGDGELEASHIPILFAPDEGPHGTLYGHLARANPQWKRISAEVSALAVVQGPDCYVSPGWYPSKAETGKVVPTWNYLAIHAHGPVEVFDAPDRLLSVVRRLTDRHEAGRPAPWSVDDAPADYLAAMLKAVVGLRLPIERLEGKWKISQNRTKEDRQGVIDGLGREDDPGSQAIAGLMTAGD